MLRAIGVVHVEQCALGERIRPTLVVGMIRIAVDLDRTECIALNQKRNCSGGKGKSSGEVNRAAQNQVFRSLDVGIDLLLGLLGASGKAGKGHGSAHELDKTAARNRIDPLGAVLRKFLAYRALEL